MDMGRLINMWKKTSCSVSRCIYKVRSPHATITTSSTAEIWSFVFMYPNLRTRLVFHVDICQILISFTSSSQSYFTSTFGIFFFFATGCVCVCVLVTFYKYIYFSVSHLYMYCTFFNTLFLVFHGQMIWQNLFGETYNLTLNYILNNE